MHLAHWSADDLGAFGDHVSPQLKNGLTLLVADWDLTKRKGGHDWYGVVVGNVCLGQPDAKLEVMPWRFCYWTFTIAIRD